MIWKFWKSGRALGYLQQKRRRLPRLEHPAQLQAEHDRPPQLRVSSLQRPSKRGRGLGLAHLHLDEQLPTLVFDKVGHVREKPVNSP
jgi:hypothetical protein